MSVEKQFPVSLDMKQETSNDPFEVVEGDTGNRIVITVTDDGETVDLSGCRVLVIFARPDGVIAEQDNDGNGVTVGGDDNNVVDVELYSTSFSPGQINAELQVYSGDGYDTLVTSAQFNFNCRRGISNDDTMQATDEWPLLQGALNELTDIARGVQADYAETGDTDPAYIKNRGDIQPATETLTAEATLADADTLPFYDADAASHRKTTWANIVSKLGELFADLFAPLTHASRHAAGGADAVSPASILAAGKSVIFDATLPAADWGADCLNLSDEVWEQGKLDTSTGAEAASDNYVRTPSANKISVTAGNHYYLSVTGASGAVLWYDASDNYLSYGSYNVDIVAPSTTAYARVRLYVPTGISPATTPKVMFSAGSTALDWEPQGRGIHLKAADYSALAAITTVTHVAAELPNAEDITSAEFATLRAANILPGYQVAATEIVLIADETGVIPDIDVPIRVIVKGDMY